MSLNDLTRLEVLNKENHLEEKKINYVDGLHKVYCLNIKDLKFNPYNDRLAMDIQTLEHTEKRKLQFDNESQERLLQLLKKENPTKYTQTKNSILKHGVLERLVADDRGIVLDGNRRLSILKTLSKEKDTYVESSRNFDKVKVIVISEPNLTEKRIRVIETALNMAQDPRLEYNPINIYLKVERLLKAESHNEARFQKVANNMGEKWNDKKVKEYHEVFKIMEKYLDFFNKSKELTKLLDKREDQFKIILKFKNGIKKRNLKVQNFDFESDQNIKDALKVLYLLVSILYEGKAFRKVIPTTNRLGILSSKEAIKTILDKCKELEIDRFCQTNTSKKLHPDKQQELEWTITKLLRELNNFKGEEKIEKLISELEECTSKITKLVQGKKLELDWIARIKEVKNHINKTLNQASTTDEFES